MMLFILFIPALLVVFFFGAMFYYYFQYKNLKPPDNQPPFPNNKELQYVNNKFSLWENIAIAVGFVIIFLLMGILFVMYRLMFKITK